MKRRERNTGTLASRALLVAVIWAASAACHLEAPTRADFTRDVPPADASPDAYVLQIEVWRATTLQVSSPSGLAGFQSFVTGAVRNNNLNFLVAAEEPDASADATWAGYVGDGEHAGDDRFRWTGGDVPPAAAEIEFTLASRRLTTSGALDFTLLIRIPAPIAIPIASATVGATLSEDEQSLTGGNLDGFVLGEVATVTLVDLQGDGDPSNDVLLSSLLGSPTADLDGDAQKDDYVLTAVFESESVELVE